ncbi:Cobalt/magnesium transport protein CorA [Methanimicrococcus stummii]|uniref:Magnesium transport protein CorA n=1 Tax=Methanimicrococcus stummii TaxID=3028294 RepID=A0AA96VJ99_9EURY|nr:magnesium/cobalt transporter CorA [Methanimicrococcus sp. Es2]WNY29416.1 Cobalt/magnesium transport protein CorA [Methanimicrococcus sp. Es2]
MAEEIQTDQKIEMIENSGSESDLKPEDPIVSKESDKVGLPPGTLMYVDDDGKDDETLKEKSLIRIIRYNESGCREVKIKSVDEIGAIVQTASAADQTTTVIGQKTNANQTINTAGQDKIWIHVSGLWDIDSVRKIGEIFQLSPLVLEDILNMEQRPKTEDYETYLFTILKQIQFDEDEKEIKDNQISIVTFEKVVLTFCENDPQIFKSVAGRIKKGGKILKYDADYLTYALIDVIVDHYLYTVEFFDEWLDDIEKRIIKNPDKEGAEEINALRHELSAFKKAIWPTITVIEKMEKSDSKLIKKQTRVLFRDIFDHVVRITDSIEADHEVLTGIYDLYTTGISNKLNDTMRILTVISTIFIPLTFIAGVYGMNFDNMPELYWKYGYYACLGLMVIIFVGMLIFFRKKKWI